MMLLHALGGIFSLLLVVSVGYLLSRKGWFSPQSQVLIPKLLTCVSLPPFLMYTFVQSFTRDNLLQMLFGTLLPFCSLILTFVLAAIVGKIARVKRKRYGLFCVCISNSNTIFVGIPVNMALFGEEAVPHVLLYYFASTIFFWTVGNLAISSDVARREADEGAVQSVAVARRNRGRDLLKNILSPPMLGFIAALVLVLFEVPVPKFLMESARYLGGLTTPLALLFVGIALQNMDLRKVRLDKDMILVLLGRLFIAPLVMASLLPFFPIPELMGKVFVAQAALPVLMQAAILSAYYRTDPEFGTLMVSLSTVLSAVTIPVLITFL